MTELIRQHGTPVVPAEDAFLAVRRNYEVARVFFNYFLPSVVGKATWKKEATQKRVSDIATVSDEALALLLLENSRETWLACYLKERKKKTIVLRSGEDGGYEETGIGSHDQEEQEEGGGQESIPLRKYTANSRNARRYGGWTQEGRARFNLLCKIVAADRGVNPRNDTKLKQSKEIEEKYLEEKSRELYGGMKGKAATNKDDECEQIYDDLSSDEEEALEGGSYTKEQHDVIVTNNVVFAGQLTQV